MLTKEQEAIVQSAGDIKINAVAGSGKTTTLIEYALARPGQRILYLAFNRAVKLEAERKFTEKGVKNVRIETAHSLAFSRVVKGSGYTVKKEAYKTTEIAGILGLENFDGKHTAFMLAAHIQAFAAYFCNSDKARVQDLVYEDVVADPAAKQFAASFRELIIRQTRVLLDKMNKGEIPIIHDFYLKKFQLSKPALPFDVILFDEGQDASAAILDIFLSQKAVKVIVGDTHQQIYAWRYAVNSLEKVDYPTFELSQSFRFDAEVAALARTAISWKRHLKLPSAMKITGTGKMGKVKTRAVIARTNTGLLVKAIELLIEKKEIGSVYFEGRIENYTYAGEGASIYDVLNLYCGEKDRVRDPVMSSMKDMTELEDYIDQTGDVQLGMLVEVVKEYGKKIPGYIKKLKESHLEGDDKAKADMVFSTVHRCKGMEYDEVTLADDFITEQKVVEQMEEKGEVGRLIEEINLLYVAVTRAKGTIYVPEHIFPFLDEGKRVKVLEKRKKADRARPEKKNAGFDRKKKWSKDRKIRRSWER